MTTELVGAMNVLASMGCGDAPMTPNNVLSALRLVPSAAGKVNDTVLYRRPSPDVAGHYYYSGENQRTTEVPGTPRDPRDWRYDEAWLLRLVEEQGEYIKGNTAGLAYPRDYAIASLRYALDKAGLTLVER